MDGFDERALGRLRQLCARYAEQRTVQLFDLHRRFSTLYPKPLATGVLIAFEDRWMVITAAHVLDSPAVHERGLVILVHGQLIDLGDFRFSRTGTAGDRRNDDDIDLAILFLEIEIVHRIQLAGLEFVPLLGGTAEVDHRPPYLSLHFLHGYPVAMTDVSRRKGSVNRVALAVFVSRYDQSRGSWPVIYPDAHIDLDYEPGKVVSPFEPELPSYIALPHPSGFSGCALWHVPVPSNVSTFEDIPVLLTGIVHRFNERLGVLRATRLEVLIHILHS